MDRVRFGISFTMNKDRKLFKRVLRGFGLPQDLDPHRFFAQWLGGAECLIEQHRGLIGFDRDRIRFETEQGILSVEGESLVMNQLSETRVLVSGGIRSISLERKS